MGESMDQGQDYLRRITKCYKPLSEPLPGSDIPTSLVDLEEKLKIAFNEPKVDLQYVNHLLLAYKSNPSDWQQYVNFNDEYYTRNLVAGNDKFNLIVLCWNTEQKSGIHDHSSSSCFMKMLQGELIEVRFKPKCEGNSCCKIRDSNVKRELLEEKQTSIKTDDVSYINDNIGMHLVKNPSSTIGAISLHLYCPPYEVCNVFEKSGESKVCGMQFHTKYGKPVDN